MAVAHECIGQTIEYDFRNRDRILGVLPFDRPFAIQFTHIDTGRVDYIVVKIYQTSITDYKRIMKDLPADQGKKVSGNRTAAITITNKDVLFSGAAWVIKLDTIRRNNFVDSTAYSTSLITLKPSTGYFIEIITGRSIPISAKEKEVLAKRIATSPKVASLINRFAKANITQDDVSFDTVNELADDLNKAVEAVVKETDPSYNFRPVNVQRNLGNLFAGIANVRDRITDLQENFGVGDSVNLKALPTYKQEVKKLLDQMEGANWFSIKKDEASGDYRAIKSAIASTKKKFAEIPAPGSLPAEFDKMMIDIDKAIEQKALVLDTLITKIWVNQVSRDGVLSATFPKEFVKQATQFIRSDLGLAYVWGIGRVNPYAAIQISLTPLDDSIPLRAYHGIWNTLRSRMSFMIGISVDGIAKDSVRKGLIGNQAVILGSGFKLWQWLKVNGGFYLYYSQPENPLIDRSRYSFKGSPFVSLSIDIRVQSLLNGIGSAIFKNQTP